MRRPNTIENRQASVAEGSPVASTVWQADGENVWFTLKVAFSGAHASNEVRVAIEYSDEDQDYWHEAIRFPDVVASRKIVARVRDGAEASPDIEDVTAANLSAASADGYVKHGPVGSRVRALTWVKGLGPGVTATVKLIQISSRGQG